ncbi:MAG: hypothetical protein AABY22_33245, partial [Nanoarchaeota archaeon]
KEEEFKVGDWVIVKEGKFNSPTCWDDGAFQISRLNPVPGRNEQYCYNSKGNNNYLSCFRKAETWEIPENTKTLKVTDYKYLIPLFKKLKIK